MVRRLVSKRRGFAGWEEQLEDSIAGTGFLGKERERCCYRNECCETRTDPKPRQAVTVTFWLDSQDPATLKQKQSEQRVYCMKIQHFKETRHVLQKFVLLGQAFEAKPDIRISPFWAFHAKHQYIALEYITKKQACIVEP